MGAISHMLSSPDPVERKVSRAYFSWLLERIDFDETLYSTYSGTINYLFSREFYSIIRNDENREGDGRYLRTMFENFGDFDDYSALFVGPASVLEVLIGMAIRMDDDWLRSCDSDPNYAAKCFWEMFKNLGLDSISNDILRDTGGYGRLESIIDRFLDRDFDRNGENGSPFPLKRCDFNARKEEFWVLMSNFCNENYNFLIDF